MAEFTRDMIFGNKSSNNEEIIQEVNEFSIDTTTEEILKLKNQTCMNIIEIGKRLKVAKDNIEFGEFGKWLNEKVDFSPRTAQIFMKIAEEFSNTNLISFLGQKKLYLLAGLEKEEREEVMEQNDIENISTRELENIVKNKKGKTYKFTGKIKNNTLKKYKDKFTSNEDFDNLIDKLLEEYFKNT